MADFSDNDGRDRLQQQLEILNTAFTPQGVLGEIAQSVVANGHELEPNEVADVLLPPKQPGTDYEARWQLVEGAPDIIKAATAERTADILRLATMIGMRREESLGEVDLNRINSERAIWLVEGGANKTSVVRRELANKAMSAIYGDDIYNKSLFQFGSDRKIPILIPDRETGEFVPNPEYGIAMEIGGDFLPMGNSLTEFQLNLMSALQGGYEIVTRHAETQGGARQEALLRKEGRAVIWLIEPEKSQGQGLPDGFNTFTNPTWQQDLNGCQFVIATNGQYRPKDELQARRWAEAHGVDMLPAVALGDEAGFTVNHNGREIVTGDRAPVAYTNEMVILHRLANS